MLSVCIFMFANLFEVLNLNRDSLDEDSSLFTESFGYPFNSVINQYLVGLGDFNTDNYSQENKIMIWLFFILATFITQITFMNLLIAIMGDTFDRVSEKKEESSYKERI
mmetsp:Transcript_26142/g.18565  ORF Transcript_26142/g.18565 Transcript_26142/m.18565 type:complete len:109 (+) Transcript_26142:1947-2273(+)